MDLIEDKNNMSAVDLGCGTGEQTSTFAEKFSSSKFLRIDSSPEMLEQSKVFKKENSNFKISTTEAIIEDDKTSDLIFSNAALQWSDNHQKLFQKIISKLNKAGQLAMQMPYQSENKLNQILFDLAVEQAYKSQLNNWNRKSAVLSIDEYAKIFFENGLSDLDLSFRIYPIIAESHDQLFDFISGSALIPYLENMDEAHREDFIKKYKNRIADNFPKLPAIYAFKRLLFYGKKS